MPEAGDLDRPKLVLFFDEAHLLFDNAPKALVDRVEQVVRLIRSKGIGVYFITQSPTDLPDDMLAQLGNRVQHALHAFTARDQKAVRAAAETFRPNPAFKTETVITELGVGEALVSTLEAKGTPGVVQRCLIAPPLSRVGPATADERRAAIGASPIAGRYDAPVDRESAYEHLKRRAESLAPPTLGRGANEFEPRTRRADGPQSRPSRSSREGMGETLAKAAVRGIGSRLGREIVRGVLGSLLRGR
jgi:DNA helicase HerA-like ATPase